MADVFMNAAKERQGDSRGDPSAGQSFLTEWKTDLSRCRLELQRNEVEIIIKDGPKGKAPGPDGVPGEVFQRYAAQLSTVFKEAWEELKEDEFSDTMYRILAMKTSLLLPKQEGADRAQEI